MSVYLVKGKGWRYDFTINGARHTEAWFKTKAEAKRAEAQKREEVLSPVARQEADVSESPDQTPTDMAFLDLVNGRLDHVQVFHSATHYRDYRYYVKRWVAKWGNLRCCQVTQRLVEQLILERKAQVSPQSVNAEIRYLRATFNWGMDQGLLADSPMAKIKFLPVEKRRRYVPPMIDIEKVIATADPEGQDYLVTIRETMARVGEINRLLWNDVDFVNRCVTLYTRKKRGGHLTPRVIPMTRKLYELLWNRWAKRDPNQPLVFWHSYWSRKDGGETKGAYHDRKKLLSGLCSRSEVRRFSFHGLRHAGASLLDREHVALGTIQRLLGHENRTTTEIYLHSIGLAEREAMDVFDRATGESHTESHTEKRRG